MLTRVAATLLSLCLLRTHAALAETPPARNVTPAAAQACLARLIVVTGLAGDDTLTLGGDQDVVLAHDRGNGSRYWAFSKAGYATVAQAWPAKASTIDVSIGVYGKTHRYRWMLKDGGMQAEATGPSAKAMPKADVSISAWRALDDAAWTMIVRIVSLKLPMVMKALEEQRAFAAKKHMPFSVALGHEDAYRDCTNLGPGTFGEQLEVVRRQHAAWKKLAEAPVVFEKCDVVRRSDHPEWRACGATADCTVAIGPCGWPDVIAKSAKSSYHAWGKTREGQINCDNMSAEDTRVAPWCDAHQCVERAATPHWNTCASNGECSIAMVCDQPVALNKSLDGLDVFWRMRWWATVDNWDKCGGVEVPIPADAKSRCVAGRCQLSP